MEENDKIDIGDFVDVFFDHNECLLDLEVLGLPQDTGDC